LKVVTILFMLPGLGVCVYMEMMRVRMRREGTTEELLIWF